MKWNCTNTLVTATAVCLAATTVAWAGDSSSLATVKPATERSPGHAASASSSATGIGQRHVHPVNGTAGEPILMTEEQLSIPTSLAGTCPPGVIYSNFGEEDLFEFFEGVVLTPSVAQRILADTVVLKEPGDVNSIGFTLANLAGSTLLSANLDLLVWNLETSGGNIVAPVLGEQIFQRNVNLPDLNLPSGTITILFEEADPGEVLFTANPPSGALWVGIRVRNVSFEFGGTIFNVGTGLFSPGNCGVTEDVVWEQGVGLFGFEEFYAGFGFQLGVDAPGACCIGGDPSQCIPNQTLAECELDHGGLYLGAGTDCADCPAAVECRIDCPDEGVPCPGDLNNSETVNVDDLLIVLNNWGACPEPCPPHCPGDANGDCVVNVDDLLIVLNNWGDCPTATITDGEDSFCEPESCGESINPGCNAEEPTFPNEWTAIENGQTVCGTIWAELQDPNDPDSGLRDTDWYSIEVTEDSTITFSVHAEFAASAFIASTDCDDFEIYETATSPFEGTPFVISQDVPPGTYALIVTTDGIFEGLPCPTTAQTGNNYTASVSVSPTTTLAACCVDAGACLDALSLSQCNAEGGTWAWPVVECGAAASACGGDTCENSVELAIGGPPVVVNLLGNEPPEQLLNVCTSGDNPNDVPVAWYTVTGNGETLRAATCGSDIFNVSVSVYCGSDCDLLSECIPTSDVICSGQLGQFQHDWCSRDGFQYWIVVHQNTSGTQPLAPVQLQVTQIGSGGCTPSNIDCPVPGEPICALDNCQQPQLTWNNAGNATSDQLTGFKIADDFTADENGSVTSICWTGVEAMLPPWGVCPDNEGQGLPFRIRYFQDDGGLPGTQIAEFVTPVNDPSIFDWQRIGFIPVAAGNLGVIEYTFNHESLGSVPVTQGECYWIEIVQLSTAEEDCRFRWLPAADNEGNGVAVQAEFDAPGYTPNDFIPPETINPDRAFCVNIALSDGTDCVGSFPGACCSADTCFDGPGDIFADDCVAPGECFFPLQTCAEVTCPGDDYRYDCGETDNAIGLIAGGVMAWVHLFEPIGGQDTITEISTTFGFAGSEDIGVLPGQAFGVALFQTVEEGGAINLGDLIWAGTSTADEASIGTDVFQSVAVNPGEGGVQVTEPFFVFAWVAQAAGTFPAPIQGSANADVGLVWAYGKIEAGFTEFDPANLDQSNEDEFFIDFFAADLVNGPWLLRANGQNGAAQMIPVPGYGNKTDALNNARDLVIPAH